MGGSTMTSSVCLQRLLLFGCSWDGGSWHALHHRLSLRRSSELLHCGGRCGGGAQSLASEAQTRRQARSETWLSVERVSPLGSALSGRATFHSTKTQQRRAQGLRSHKTATKTRDTCRLVAQPTAAAHEGKWLLRLAPPLTPRAGRQAPTSSAPLPLGLSVPLPLNDPTR